MCLFLRFFEAIPIAASSSGAKALGVEFDDDLDR